MERETGIEPATNSLEGCDSTTELLPPGLAMQILELMMGLEPMTSPLPRECSTTELHQPLQPTFQSYRERSRPSMTRKAKNPNRIHVSDRNFPGSIVCQAIAANNPIPNSAIHILPLPAGLRSTTFTSPTNNPQISGAQGRIRTSVTRCVADLQSAAINHSATCAHPAKPSSAQPTSQPIKPVLRPRPRIERVSKTLKV